MQIEVCNPKLRTTELVPYILYRVNSWSSSAECAWGPRIIPSTPFGAFAIIAQSQL